MRRIQYLSYFPLVRDFEMERAMSVGTRSVWILCQMHVGVITPCKIGSNGQCSTIHLSIDFVDCGKSFILQCVRTTVIVACNDGIIPQKSLETPPMP
mmetsp:Transcript_42572/g.77761  ORF Transcript_42572/g.77761 Transcript_42572/m.77761 type:complete len:97 (+) Transcript_42572:56-346(+)